MVEQLTIQLIDGGSIPTSPLQLRVEVINKEMAHNIFRRWHYLGETDFISTIDFGASFDNRCVGALSFGSPNAKELYPYFDRHTQEGWYEIKRLAMEDECPKNSESRFIGIAIKLLRKAVKVRGIITYADSGVGHEGIIYRATGFEYKGLTDKKSDFWVNGAIQQRGKTKGIYGEWKPRSQKHLYVKVYG